MKITIQSVGIGEGTLKKYDEKVIILVNDQAKYIGICNDLIRKNITIQNPNGQMLFSGQNEKAYLYTFSSNEKKIKVETVKGKRNYRIIDNGQELEVRSHLAGKYTHYPIYLNGNEIAEGVQKMTSKQFSIEFNLYMLDSFEDHLDAICLFCIFLFFKHLIYDIKTQSTTYGFELQLFKPKFVFDKEWLNKNFNADFFENFSPYRALEVYIKRQKIFLKIFQKTLSIIFENVPKSFKH